MPKSVQDNGAKKGQNNGKGRIPTLKQREFVREYVKSGNGTQAAIAAYDTKDPLIASTIANQNLNKPQVQQLLEQALIEAGLTDSEIAGSLRKVVQKGLDSEKVTASDALKSLDMVLRIKGGYAATKQVHAKLDLNKLYSEMPYNEVIKEIKKTREVVDGLISEDTVPTPQIEDGSYVSP